MRVRVRVRVRVRMPSRPLEAICARYVSNAVTSADVSVQRCLPCVHARVQHDHVHMQLALASHGLHAMRARTPWVLLALAVAWPGSVSLEVRDATPRLTCPCNAHGHGGIGIVIATAGGVV